MAKQAHENLEIVFIQTPPSLGNWRGDTHRDLHISVRMGKLTELLSGEPNTLSDGILQLYVVDESDLGVFQAQNPALLERLPHDIGLFVLTSGRVKGIRADSIIVGEASLNAKKDDLIRNLINAAHRMMVRHSRARLETLEASRTREANAIHAVGLAMAGQQNIEDVLRVVLEKAVDLSNADAGFLLLREHLFALHEHEEDSVKLLRRSGTKYVQKARQSKSQAIRLHPDMLNPHTSEFIARVSNRGCGVSWDDDSKSPTFWRDTLQIPDSQWPEPRFEFDENCYLIKSYCVFPLKTPNEEVVGLIILLNRRSFPNVPLKSKADVKNCAMPFNEHDLTLIEALSNQAGVSIDHTRLYRELKRVFESFVTASVTAIESRDPSTKGHSERVAIMTVGFAEAINSVRTGPYSNTFFTPSQLYEIKYASLLHDFGKIGVREDVLRKKNKLFPHELDLIKERFEIIENKLHVKCLEAYITTLMQQDRAPSADDLARIKKEIAGISDQLSDLWGAILEANEPQIVREERVRKLIDFAALKLLVNDEKIDLITEPELTRLSIKRGSLSEVERQEIESHVTHSYRFLIQIPWTSELANIPDIVYGHHERLDGSGYPRKLISDEIPVQAKLMAITDIYDALVAMDRPYKKAVSHERALQILSDEVREGKLDAQLFQVFHEARIGDLIAELIARAA